MHQHCLTSLTLTWLLHGWIFDFYCTKHQGFLIKFLNNLGLTFLNYLTANYCKELIGLLSFGVVIHPCLCKHRAHTVHAGKSGRSVHAGWHSQLPSSTPFFQGSSCKLFPWSRGAHEGGCNLLWFPPQEWCQSCKHTGFPHKSRMGCLQGLCQGVTVLGSTRMGRRHRLIFVGFNIPTNYFSTQAAQTLSGCAVT